MLEERLLHHYGVRRPLLGEGVEQRVGGHRRRHGRGVRRWPRRRRRALGRGHHSKQDAQSERGIGQYAIADRCAGGFGGIVGHLEQPGAVRQVAPGNVRVIPGTPARRAPPRHRAPRSFSQSGPIAGGSSPWNCAWSSGKLAVSALGRGEGRRSAGVRPEQSRPPSPSRVRRRPQAPSPGSWPARARRRAPEGSPASLAGAYRWSAAVGVTPAGLSQSSIGRERNAGPVGACMAMA